VRRGRLIDERFMWGGVFLLGASWSTWAWRKNKKKEKQLNYMVLMKKKKEQQQK